MVSRDDGGGDAVCAWNPEANDIFVQAIEIKESAVRLQFLDTACGRNTPLRADVESLLAASERAGSFLDRPPTDVAAAIETLEEPPSLSERPGSLIGPYRLLEQIGEGGLGTVFLAEQAAPVRRRVALKVIKPGMDTKQVIARFEAERQALALMDHPHVARFFDANQTATARSYFVMEHVPGLPITDYCDAGRLRIRQRLELFVLICHAVQHAHQKGVIHRDLKPSNILVTLVDGKPVPKVIDFGIAKAITTPLTERTLHTEIGRLMGTPEYMSPEQAGSSGVDVDTRSDVYSLGVILYQLLTGTLPFDPKTLRGASYDGIVKIIREMEPPRPSTRLSTLGSEPVNQRSGAAPKEIAERRDTDFAVLQRQLRGELDWIVMKCLEKDRARRYETASALAEDVRRYLAGEPIEAKRDSLAYVVRKQLRRHWATVTVTAGFVLLLTGGLVTSLTFWQGATQAADDAGRAASQAREAEREATFSLADAYLAQAREIRLRQQPGFTVESLALVKKAARIQGSTLALRNEALASLAQSDLVVESILSVPERAIGTLASQGSAALRWPGGNRILVRPQIDSEKGEYWINPPDEGDEIGVVELSLDGKHLISTYQRRFSTHVRLFLWDVAARRWLWSEPIPGQVPFIPVEFSPDGQFVAVAHPDRTVRFHALADGQVTRVIQHGIDLFDILFRTAGPATPSLLLSDRNKPRVIVWDLATNAQDEIALPSPARILTQSNDGRWLALGCASGRILIYPLDSGADYWRTRVGCPSPHAILSGHDAMIKGLYFSLGGELLVSRADDETTCLWDVARGRERFAFMHGVEAIGATDDCILLREQGRACVRRSQATTLCKTFPAPGGTPIFIDDRWFVIARGAEGSLTIWDIETGALHERLRDADVNGACVTPSGLLASTDDGLLFWPIDTDAPVPRVGPPEVVWAHPKLVGLCLTPGKDEVFASDDADRVWRIPLDDPAAATVFVEQLGARARSVSADGSRLVVGHWRGDGVAVYATSDARRLATFPYQETGNAFEFGRFVERVDGRELLIIAASESYHFLDAETYEERQVIRRSGWLTMLATTSDGSLAVVTQDGGTPLLVELESFEVLAELTLPQPNSTISDLAFNPSGTTLVMTTDSGVAFVWDLRAMREQLVELGLDWPRRP